MPRHRIGIVGLGVAGAALGTMLARHGHAVTILERAPAPGPVGAGFLLQPSGQSVLQRLGLLDEVTATAEPVHAVRAVRTDGRTVVHLPFADLRDGRHAFGVGRGALFTTLHRAALDAGVVVVTGAEVTGIDEDGRLLSAGRGPIGPFDLVVACDGARSALRDAHAPARRVHPYAWGALWGVARCDTVRGRLHQVVRGTGLLAGVLPIGGGRASIFWSVRNDRVPTLRAAGFEAWRETVVATCPEAAPAFDDLRSFDDLVHTGYGHVWPGPLAAGSVALVGDAAHAMSPHLGQGANLALLGAERLAATLGTPGDDLASALARYDAATRREVRFVSLATYALTPFFQSDGRLKGVARDLALPLMCRCGPVRRRMVMTMAGLVTGPGAFLRGPGR